MYIFSLSELTRRHFLAAGLASLTALVGLPLMAAPASFRRVRYCAITPEMDDLSPGAAKANLGWVLSENPKTVSISGIEDDYTKGRRTLLTIVDKTGQNIRRLWVPGLLHTGTFFGDYLFLITRGEPGLFYVLDVNKSKIVDYRKPDAGFLFGGHVIPWVEPGQFAITVNEQRKGAYDRVDLYDGRRLEKFGSFNSYGFQAHELTLTPDKKNLYVGHYGSYFASGPYRDMAAEQTKKLNAPMGSLGDHESMSYYMGSISVIDPIDGTFKKRLHDFRNGPHGHLAASLRGQVLLSRVPPLVTSMTEDIDGSLYAEGSDHKICNQKQYTTLDLHSSGTTIVIDNEKQQYLLPITPKLKMAYGSLENPEQVTEMEVSGQGHFGHPLALAFHPDGNHYILSCENGFVVMKRGSHEYVEEMSVPLQLGWHSHIAIG